jgi:hypothetical protein
MIDNIITVISICFTIILIFSIISFFFNVYTFGITIDNNINSFMDNNKNKDTNFKNTLQDFFKFTKSITNILLPTLPTINTKLNLPQNLRNAIPIVPKPNIDTFNINCSLSNISIYYPDPEKIAECAGDTVLAGARAAYETAEKAYGYSAQGYEEASQAVSGAVDALDDAVGETGRIAGAAAQGAVDTANAAYNGASTAVNESLNAVGNTLGNIGNLAGAAVGAVNDMLNSLKFW